MAHLAAQLLDELMGRNRNALPTEKTKELTYNDAEICKYYLVKFCPHDLFHNTKADLGPCPKIHDDAVRTKYNNDAPHHTKTKFEDEFLKFCRSMLAEVERKIVKGEQRLAQSQGVSGLNSKLKGDDQVALLTDKINQLVKEAEKLGTEGNVEQAQGLLKLSEQLKSEREAIQKGDPLPFSNIPEKLMEVCRVCGAFLIVGDAPARIDDHMQGKQHVGYQKLRAAVDEIIDGREKARQEREHHRSRETDDRRKRSEDERRRESERDRTRRHRSRSRSRERSHKHDRRDREHHRERDRDRETKRRSRSRSRDRHREKDRRSGKERSSSRGASENGHR